MSAAGLSPQALAEACARVMWDNDNATRHLGMELVSIAPGEAVIAMDITDAMTNGHGICHGGYMFTLAEVYARIFHVANGTGAREEPCPHPPPFCRRLPIAF